MFDVPICFGSDENTTGPEAANSDILRQARPPTNLYRAFHGKSDDHRKLQVDTASAGAFGAVLDVDRVTVRDGNTRFLRTRNTGAAHGVHARRAQALQRFNP